MYKTKARQTRRMCPAPRLEFQSRRAFIDSDVTRSRTGLSRSLRRIPALENWTI
ncbi:hypothetical protein FQN60_009112 [Etheostoma spectabile]|uniref:Uncharacterized protein n=1 Tax=Etheostoma spectabile TaxID=54343 RepID=A0A5J5CKF7_9PERO|nr:hypothetical protein FQN60_009112 [Etheostoma spectabile]